MKRLLFFAIPILLLFGCGGLKESQKLRDKPPVLITFKAEMNYEVVYKKIMDMAVPCYQRSSSAVVGNMYSNTRAAHIEVIFITMDVGTNQNLMINIEADGDNSTTVNMYTANTDLADATKEWVINDYKECRIPKKNK